MQEQFSTYEQYVLLPEQTYKKEYKNNIIYKKESCMKEYPNVVERTYSVCAYMRNRSCVTAYTKHVACAKRIVNITVAKVEAILTGLSFICHFGYPTVCPLVLQISWQVM